MVLGSRIKLSNKILRKNYIEYTLGSEKENKLPMPKLCVCVSTSVNAENQNHILVREDHQDWTRGQHLFYRIEILY